MAKRSKGGEVNEQEDFPMLQSLTAPYQPTETEMKLYKASRIKAISVSVELYDCDKTRTTYCLTPAVGKRFQIADHLARKYLKVCLDWNSVAELKEEWAERCRVWEKWEARNKKDLAELKRLQAKLGVPRWGLGGAEDSTEW